MSLKTLHGSLITQYEIGSKYLVNVTYINHPHDFYIRPVMYGQFMSALEKKGAPMEIHEIQLHQIIIFKSQQLPIFARGRIAFIHNEAGELSYDIFALDYGFLEKSVLSKNIYHPDNEDIISIPPLALHCQLDLCFPRGGSFSDKAINLTKHFLGNELGTAQIRNIIGDKYIVLMENTRGDVGTHLFLANCSFFLSSLHSHTSVETHSNVPEYKYKQFKVDDVLHVRAQSGNSLKGFFVAEMKDFKVFMEVRDELTNFYRYKNNISPQEMIEGKAICVLVDFKYERAMIKQIIIPKSKALVQLLDWGTIMEVDISKMKPVSAAALDKPVIAIYCSTDESQTWDNGLGRFLYPGYEFKITIKEVGDNFNTPNIVDVSHTLKF